MHGVILAQGGAFMIRHLLRLSRSLAIGMAAAALTLALVSPPAALADDRLNFTGTTLSGAPFDGASLQGKPAVLWFWTPWSRQSQGDVRGCRGSL
jgi:hypothetical protein